MTDNRNNSDVSLVYSVSVDVDRETVVVENAHDDIIRDVDYNPNKPYHVVTCGQHLFVCFRRSRYLISALVVFDAFPSFQCTSWDKLDRVGVPFVVLLCPDRLAVVEPVQSV